MGDLLVWVDCEMTGLDLGKDALVEVAALVTDPDLNVLGEGVDVVIHADDTAARRHGGDRPRDARQVRPHRCRPRLHGHPGRSRRHDHGHTSRPTCTEPRTAPLCGNSIATDRGFLARDMPTFDSYLHYRMIDVSSIKELCRRWYPRTYFGQPAKGLAHRALADIRESIRELEYYRRTVFVPEARAGHRRREGDRRRRGAGLPDHLNREP